MWFNLRNTLFIYTILVLCYCAHCAKDFYDHSVNYFDGKEVKLEQYRGKVPCPCKAAFPGYLSIYLSISRYCGFKFNTETTNNP